MAITQLDAVDANGNTVTLYESDDPPEAADVNAVETSIDNQTNWSEVNVGPTLDSTFSSSYDAVLLASAGGTLDFTDGSGSDVSIPSGALSTGTPYQFEIQEIQSSSGISASDIILLRE